MKWEILEEMNFHLNSCVTLFQKPPSVWEFFVENFKWSSNNKLFFWHVLFLWGYVLHWMPGFSCKFFFFFNLEWLIIFFSVYRFNAEKTNHDSHTREAIRLLIQVLYSRFLWGLVADFLATEQGLVPGLFWLKDTVVLLNRRWKAAPEHSSWEEQRWPELRDALAGFQGQAEQKKRRLWCALAAWALRGGKQL